MNLRTPNNWGLIFKFHPKIRQAGLSSFLSLFWEHLEGWQTYPALPPVTTSNCLANRRQLITSSPGLSPLCHTCCGCNSTVVQGRAPSEAVPGNFGLWWSPFPQLLGSALFDHQMPKNICAQRADVILGGRTGWPQWRRVQHCPK